MPRRRTKAEQEALMREVRESHQNPPPPPQMQTVIASCGHEIEIRADEDPAWTQREGVCPHCARSAMVSRAKE